MCTSVHMFEKKEVKAGIYISRRCVNVLNESDFGMFLEASQNGDEVTALEKVREEWCQCLTRPGLNESEFGYFKRQSQSRLLHEMVAFKKSCSLNEVNDGTKCASGHCQP